MKWLLKKMHVFDKIELIINIFCSFIFLVLIVMVFTNVVLRYGFNKNITISVELSRYIFVWLVYIGSIVALAKNQHLSVNFCYEYFPEIIKKSIARLVLLIMGVISLIFAFGSYQQMQVNWSNLSPISGMPIAVFYLAGMISGGSMFVVILFKIFYTPECIYINNFSEDK